MLLQQFRPWFDALCADDVDLVEVMLAAATAKERDILLNGLFDYRFVAPWAGSLPFYGLWTIRVQSWIFGLSLF